MNKLELSKFNDVEMLEREFELLASKILLYKTDIWIKASKDNIDQSKLTVDDMKDMSMSVTNILIEKIKEEQEKTIKFTEAVTRSLGFK